MEYEESLAQSERMTEEFLSKQSLPFTAYEVNYIWHTDANNKYDQILKKCEVKPIKILTFGISEGCSAPSISAKDSNGRKFLGSVEDYYPTEKSAQLVANEAMQYERKKELEKNGGKLAIEELSAKEKLIEIFTKALSNIANMPGYDSMEEALNQHYDMIEIAREALGEITGSTQNTGGTQKMKDVDRPSPEMVKEWEKLKALLDLQKAIKDATKTGLFDEMAGNELHPTTINDFCDGIEERLSPESDKSDRPRP